MMTTAMRTIRAAPINRELATGRVPFGLIPVTAATAARATARPSHTIQSMAITLQDASHDDLFWTF